LVNSTWTVHGASAFVPNLEAGKYAGCRRLADRAVAAIAPTGRETESQNSRPPWAALLKTILCHFFPVIYWKNMQAPIARALPGTWDANGQIMLNHWEGTVGRSSEEIAAYKARIAQYSLEIGWFHSFDFGNGLVAEGMATLPSLSQRVSSLGLDMDIAGRTFLDIASWDGFYAFEAERRGASRVLATDKFCWGGPGWGKKDGFLLAREILRSKVEDKDVDVNEISPTTVGEWDIVLFSGIFYHMRDPIQAITAAASVCRDRFIVETHIYNDDIAAPVMQYVPRTKGINANSNYWRPNSALIIQVLKDLDFSQIENTVKIDPPGGNDSTHGFFNAYRK
jgi:tRNA (mo5U34)-methyltransferase